MVSKVALLTAGGFAPCLSSAIGGLVQRYTAVAPEVVDRHRRVLASPIEVNIVKLVLRGFAVDHVVNISHPHAVERVSFGLASYQRPPHRLNGRLRPLLADRRNTKR